MSISKNKISVVAGIIYNTDGRFLIARKKESKALAGYWEFPGGKIETHERPQEALLREIREEFAIEITVLDFLLEYPFSYPFTDIHFYFYKAFTDNSSLKPVDHDRVAWIIPEEMIRYNFAPGDRPFTAYLLAKLTASGK